MLFKHSAIYILAKLIPGLMAFAALSIYSHLLTPSEYGIYTLLFTGSVLLHNVIFNWLSSGTLRYWANSPYSKSEFTNTLAVTFIKILSVLSIFSVIGIIYFWQQQQAVWIVNVFLLMMALALYTITQNVFSASIRPTHYAYLTITYSILALLFGVLFAKLDYGASGVIFGIALGTFCSSIYVFKSTWLPINAKEYKPELFTRFMRYGMPLAAAMLIEEITKVTDRFMLAGLRDKAEAGLYAVGYDMSGNSVLMIMAAINVAAYPVIIKLLDEEGLKASTDYFNKYVVLLLGVSIPAVIGLNLVGPNLVQLLIDTSYQETVIFLLPWITTAIFLLGLQVFYFDLAFQLGEKTVDSVKVAAIIAVVNIALNFYLIPKLGIHGAAIATITSIAFGCIISIFYGRKYFTLPFPAKDIFYIIIATIGMTVCLWFFKDKFGWLWLLLQLAIGIISFASIIIIFNVLESRDQIIDYLNRKAKN